MLLVLVAYLAGNNDMPQAGDPRGPGPGHPRLLTPEAPEPTPATGELAVVVEEASPAVLRIESRCRTLFGAMPVDVGSGFFVSDSGRVLSAYHVVRRQGVAGHPACGLRYVAIDGAENEYELELVGFDARQDIALLQAQVEEPVSYLPLAAALPEVGSEIVAIGNSRGEFFTDKAGEVTRLDVDAGQPQFASGTIELTAAVAPGDSGGPVINGAGEAVGVVSFISFQPSHLAADGDDLLSGLLRRTRPAFASYAVPVLEGSELVEALAAGMQRDIPVIGFEAAFDYDPRRGGRSGLGPRPGVVVGRVDPSGPGASAGLRSLTSTLRRDAEGEVVGRDYEGDVITSVEGTPTPNFDALLRVIRSREVGETVTVAVQRGPQELELTMELTGYREVFE